MTDLIAMHSFPPSTMNLFTPLQLGLNVVFILLPGPAWFSSPYVGFCRDNPS